MASATATASAAAAVPGLSFRRAVVGLRRPAAAPPPLRNWRLRASFPSSSFFATLKRSPKRLKYSSQRLFKKGEGMVYVKVDPSGEDTWKLEPIIDLIKEGAVGVIPTDTVYSIVCDLKIPSSIERLRRIKGIGDSKPLSILCHSLKDIDTYTTGFPRGNNQGQTNIFRAVKHCLPGPYTFILPASKQLPKQCIRNGATTKYAQRKHVGVRIPDDVICQAILQRLDAPLICTSVKWPSEDQWILDPAIIADVYEKEGLDFVVDGGLRVADPSTVVDMTGSYPRIIRQGKGPKLDWMVAEGEDHGPQPELAVLQAA
ncbi:uncharacterized protein LOC109710462 [Ananas comosus]|uniref:Threonylcarbamoyl-AMP synthase n=1 Tax=Ananas comosus TaxID=4615 RepID=A0A6P5F586_ANACO|nr:uncharacterized protein LOC109710462 [Ananas comosus]XP_020088634.1 uncharacterized protein LOC109710462 [Ananas comosus]XP_020088635.1 uncharacterized protein LOC109710462 [Ananas comosus]XP_020088636.1 uncharacterized protein LOC109710462 [Ananas comosus]XP_020088637.1 uncharacterized protein LOC109710462 [Ananas comosus]XP_020088638.1 uncharacterized protein LOC109710462 [Ananas comosus]XP_020088639.1 uncharacterized protein LOC109710462 [Ananas comosus]XP_020088640.1 uncharacterized p